MRISESCLDIGDVKVCLAADDVYIFYKALYLSVPLYHLEDTKSGKPCNDYIKNKAFFNLGWNEITSEDIYKANKYELLKHVTDGSYEEYMMFMESELQAKYNKTISSKAYRIGKKLAWLPRALKGLVKKA